MSDIDDGKVHLPAASDHAARAHDPFGAQREGMPREGRAAHPALSLQQKVGNQAFGRLLQSGGDAPLLGSADVYERQADWIAGRIADPSMAARSREPDGPRGQLRGAAASRGGDPLPSGTRAFFERHLGHDLGGVRVHRGAGAEATAALLSASAYTVGQDITFAAGRYDPESAGGRRLLAHELTHVVQQTAARPPRGLATTGGPSVQLSRDGYIEAMNRKPHPDWDAAVSNLEGESPEAVKEILGNLSPDYRARLHRAAIHSSAHAPHISRVTKADYQIVFPEEAKARERQTQKRQEEQQEEREKAPAFGAHESAPKDASADPLILPDSSWQQLSDFAQAARAADQRREQDKSDHPALADGTVVSLRPQAPARAVPARPAGEVTKDLTVTLGGKTVVVERANVQGDRAPAVTNLTADLKRIEGDASAGMYAAQAFLEEWKVARKASDIAAAVNPPDLALWRRIFTLVEGGKAALEAGDLPGAEGALAGADKQLANVRADWDRYRESNFKGAADVRTGLEVTRDASALTLAALATLASGGATLTTVGGFEVDAVTAVKVISEGAPLLTTAATTVAEIAGGDKVDWGKVGADVAVQLTIARLGGKPLRGIFGSLIGKKAVLEGGKQVAEKVAQAVLPRIGQDIVAGAESRLFGHGVDLIRRWADDEITWDDAVGELGKSAVDPQAILFDALTSEVHARAAVLAGGRRGSPPDTAAARRRGSPLAFAPPSAVADAESPATEGANPPPAPPSKGRPTEVAAPSPEKPRPAPADAVTPEIIYRPLSRRRAEDSVAPGAAEISPVLAEAQGAAGRRAGALPRRQQQKTVAASARAIREIDGIIRRSSALSGWGLRRGPRPRVSAEEVARHAEEIGHQLAPSPRDNLRHDGFSGRYNASHAEKQQSLARPNEDVHVTRPMCPDCVAYFRAEARFRGRAQVVSDPQMTRTFHPDGSITEAHTSGAQVRVGGDGAIRLVRPADSPYEPPAAMASPSTTFGQAFAYASADPAKLAKLRQVYPKRAASLPDSTPVFRYASSAKGMGHAEEGQAHSGCTFWQTERPNPSYTDRFLVAASLGQLRATGEVRLDELEANQGGDAGSALIAIHRAGTVKVPGEAHPTVGVTMYSHQPVFDPGSSLYVKPTERWRGWDGEVHFPEEAETAATKQSAASVPNNAKPVRVQPEAPVRTRVEIDAELRLNQESEEESAAMEQEAEPPEKKLRR